ncbi:MAG: hypothetical protein IJD48_01115, partial [Clostridia bacterium]|nr:hypothetical protein [Clostridia bacterium]
MEKNEQSLNELETKNEEKEITTKRVGNIQVEKRKKPNKTLIITAIALSAIVIAMVVFALVNKLNTNVYSNVYVNDVKVAGMTEQEVAQTVKKMAEEFKKR